MNAITHELGFTVLVLDTIVPDGAGIKEVGMKLMIIRKKNE